VLMVRVLDENFSQPHYLQPVCQEAGDPLTDRGGDGELFQFILKGVRDDGVTIGAEVYKQDPHINISATKIQPVVH